MKFPNQNDQTPKCECLETATCIVIFDNWYWRGVRFFCDECAAYSDEKLRPNGYPGNIGRRVVLYEATDSRHITAEQITPEQLLEIFKLTKANLSLLKVDEGLEAFSLSGNDKDLKVICNHLNAFFGASNE